jgi:glycosyltransferase involved in cell wall biosynthesis
MKILHVGNMANIGYMISKQLRLENYDLDLLMEKNPVSTENPLKLDSSLNNLFPNWISFYDKQSSWKRFIIKKMRGKQYDLIHAYVELPIFAYLSGRPFVAHPQGSDLREMAFSNSIRGILLRRAYRKAKAVIVSSPEQITLVKKLKLKNVILLPFTPEYPFFTPEIISREIYRDKLIIFHPANLDWKGKGNDILIKGFAKNLTKNPNMILIIVDRGIDSQKTHDLVNSLKIINNVQFLSGPLDYQNLKYYYNISDIIADQFILGELGGIARESLCCGKPLLTSFNKEGYQKIYSEIPPILDSNSTLEVIHHLENLQNKTYREKIGKENRLWVQQNSSLESLAKKLSILYCSIVRGESFSEIQKKIGNQQIFQN